MASEHELRLIIKAIDQASATLKSIKAETGAMGEDFASAAEAARPLGLALTAVGAAGTALIGTTALTAARVEVLGVVLNTVGENAGYTEEELAIFEESVKALGITTGAARQGLIQLMQAELDLTDATALARMAQDAAVIANLNSSDAYEQLITVIQRGSPVMARTMGLNVDFQASYERMAEQLGISTVELTANQKMQARLNEVLEQGGDIAGSYEAAMGMVGKQLTSLPRYYEEAAEALGTHYQPLLETVVETQTDLLQSFIDLEPHQQAAAANWLGLGTAVAGAGGALILTVPKIADTITALSALNTVAVAAGIGLGPIGLAGAALVAMYAFTRLPAVQARAIESNLGVEASSIAAAQALRDQGGAIEVVRKANYGIEASSIAVGIALRGVAGETSNLTDGWNSQHSPALRRARELMDGWANSMITARERSEDLDRAIGGMTRDVHISIYWDHYGSPDHPGGGGQQQYQHGTKYVPQTGLALLHKGEAVIPAHRNPVGAGGGGGGESRSGGVSTVININFGRDSIRDDQDVLLVADAIRDALEIRGVQPAL